MKKAGIIIACLMLAGLTAIKAAAAENDCYTPVKTEAGLVRGMPESSQ